jgi:hypothetical protein
MVSPDIIHGGIKNGNEKCEVFRGQIPARYDQVNIWKMTLFEMRIKQGGYKI